MTQVKQEMSKNRRVVGAYRIRPQLNNSLLRTQLRRSDMERKRVEGKKNDTVVNKRCQAWFVFIAQAGNINKLRTNHLTTTRCALWANTATNKRGAESRVVRLPSAYGGMRARSVVRLPSAYGGMRARSVVRLPSAYGGMRALARIVLLACYITISSENSGRFAIGLVGRTTQDGGVKTIKRSRGVIDFSCSVFYTSQDHGTFAVGLVLCAAQDGCGLSDQIVVTTSDDPCGSGVAMNVADDEIVRACALKREWRIGRKSCVVVAEDQIAKTVGLVCFRGAVEDTDVGFFKGDGLGGIIEYKGGSVASLGLKSICRCGESRSFGGDGVTSKVEGGIARFDRGVVSEVEGEFLRGGRFEGDGICGDVEVIAVGLELGEKGFEQSGIAIGEFVVADVAFYAGFTL